MVISIILPIVISIANHGISDFKNNLRDFVDEQDTNMENGPLMTIFFSFGKNLLVFTHLSTTF